MKSEQEILAAIDSHKKSIMTLKQWRDAALTNETYSNYQRSIDFHEEIILTLYWVLEK